ncbi:MAG: hypothetical protein RSD07_11140, partial [Angelakisella sp.]
MYRQTRTAMQASVLIRKALPFVRPLHLTQAEQFMIANPVPREIPTTAERLRYYRFQCAMLQ